MSFFLVVIDPQFNHEKADKPNSTGHFYLFTTIYAEQILKHLDTEASSPSAQNQLATLLSISKHR